MKIARKLTYGILRRSGFKLVRYPTRSFKPSHLEIYDHLSTLYAKIVNVPGSIVECGYGLGDSFSILCYLSRTEKREIWSYDSFAGFPTPHILDSSYRNAKKGEWRYRSRPEAKSQVENFLKKLGFNNTINFVEGFVEKSLHKTPPTAPIAFLHIDLDLYEGYKAVLENCYHNVSPGGIILFDEYGTKEWPGATRAVDNFMKDKVEILEISESGKAYIVKA